MQPPRADDTRLRALPGDVFTVKEAAYRLRASTAAIYRLCEQGKLRHVRISTHSIRIAASDLAAFITTRRAAGE